MVRGARLSDEAKREIVARHRDGDKQVEIAASYKVSPSCISKILAKANGADGCGKDTLRPGRPPILSPEGVAILEKAAQENPNGSAADIAKKHVELGGAPISRVTAWRTLKRAGVRCLPAAQKPLLTARHRKTRLAWAMKYRLWTDEEWEHVLFSDESTIETMPAARKPKVYRRKDQRLDPRFIRQASPQNHGLGVLWWGATRSYQAN